MQCAWLWRGATVPRSRSTSWATLAGAHSVLKHAKWDERRSGLLRSVQLGAVACAFSATCVKRSYSSMWAGGCGGCKALRQRPCTVRATAKARTAFMRPAACALGSRTPAALRSFGTTCGMAATWSRWTAAAGRPACTTRPGALASCSSLTALTPPSSRCTGSRHRCVLAAGRPRLAAAWGAPCLPGCSALPGGSARECLLSCHGHAALACSSGMLALASCL